MGRLFPLGIFTTLVKNKNPMKRSPIEVFSEWAELDKDFGMEENHKASVAHMLSYTLKELNSFSFIDAGCGNGWVVRQLSKNPNCQEAIGVDGSEKMIAKAKSIDPELKFYCANLMDWTPEKKVNLVHSMEVFYYLKDPQQLLSQIHNSWLKKGGRLIIGLDFYKENTVSHNWPEQCGITIMKLFSQSQWEVFFKKAGFQLVESWRFGSKENWEGTLIVTGIK